MGTGYMMWRSQVADGARYAVRDGATGDEMSIKIEYVRTHGRIFRCYVFGFPLLFTGIAITYYAPFLVAVDRRHPRVEMVFLINTFLGPTLIGWGWALRIALNGVATRPTGSVNA